MLNFNDIEMVKREVRKKINTALIHQNIKLNREIEIYKSFLDVNLFKPLNKIFDIDEETIEILNIKAI